MAITVTRCDGQDSTDVRYPPFCIVRVKIDLRPAIAHNVSFWSMSIGAIKSLSRVVADVDDNY